MNEPHDSFSESEMTDHDDTPITEPAFFGVEVGHGDDTADLSDSGLGGSEPDRRFFFVLEADEFTAGVLPDDLDTLWADGDISKAEFGFRWRDDDKISLKGSISNQLIGGIVTTQALPEPTSMALLSIGALSYLGVARRRRRNAAKSDPTEEV